MKSEIINQSDLLVMISLHKDDLTKMLSHVTDDKPFFVIAIMKSVSKVELLEFQYPKKIG